MIPPNGEKRYHPKSSLFSFFGNLSPNNSGELTKKGNLVQNTCGIKNTLEVVSLYSLVKTLIFIVSYVPNLKAIKLFLPLFRINKNATSF